MMNMKIIIHILLCLVFYQQGVVTIYQPTGPSFVSIVSTRQRLYYNTLGTRLDCTANGTPPPVLTWFRTNGSDDRPSTFVQSSELIDVFENGSLFIRSFRDYSKSIHAGKYICRAENAAGSIQTTPVQLKPQIYDTYEIEVKNTYGYKQSSAILSCEISPPSASSYVHVIGWLEKINNQITQLDLRPRTKYNLLSNKNLIIHNITNLDDNRAYACIIMNQIDNDTKHSRFKSLRVRDRSPFGPELSIPNNTEYRAQAGDLIELPCGISSVSTHARVSWWRNSMEMDHITERLYNHSLILQLSRTSSNDSGTYACRIDDELGGRMISSMLLKVSLPLQCKMSIQEKNFNAGSNTELICMTNLIKSVPSQWQWYHNSNRLSTNNDRYLINNLTRNDMGMYQCCYIMSSSDLNACCAQTQLRVINSPPFILSDHQTNSNIIVISSKNISHVSIDLNMTIYADPMPIINLYKDGQQLISNNQIQILPSGDIFTHYRILILNIDHTGLYEYRVKNSFGSISYSKHINIEGQKPSIQTISNLTIVSGKQFILGCYVSGQPNLHMRWIDDTTKKIMNTSLTSPILLTSINTQSNSYTCEAKNPYGDDFRKVFVQIQIPSKILSSTPNKILKVNETLNIFCLAEGDNQFELKLVTPLAKRFNAIEIISNNNNKKTLSLTIDNIQMSDSGFYECYAKNNYSEDRSKFEIIVQNVPDKIENIFIENSNQITWNKPFDGNSKLLQYIFHIKYRQGLSWSNETIIVINDSSITTYLFENLYSKCTISISIEAVNTIGSSLPSHFQFQTNVKQLLIAPYNLTAVNLSSKSVVLAWQYPTLQLCNDSYIEYVIEVIDENSQSIIQTYKHHSTVFIMNHLKSFTKYTFIVYAINELGPSPKSKSLTIQTLESVPLATITDLTAILLDGSSARVMWSLENYQFELLHGKLRAFAVTIYENFNMSTLATIETANSSLTFNNLHFSTEYFISVAVCNSFDCGPSSLAIIVETPTLDVDLPVVITHPVNKPLLLHCPLTSSWLHKEKSIDQYIFSNNSLYIPHSKLTEIDNQYQCGTKHYKIQLYDKPSPVDAKVYYTTSNEIGIKLTYPLDIIESIGVSYKTDQNLNINEYQISPPLSNIRLTNLSCGNTYEIRIYAKNQVGSSSNEYLISKTDGSVPSLMQPKDLIETISNNFIILNMSSWIVNQCLILSYDIEIFPIINASDINHHRHYSFKNNFKTIRISNLQSNQDYQLHVKVNSQAGETIKIILFRTTSNNNELYLKRKSSYLLIIIVSIIILFILSMTVFILMKFCQIHIKKADLFLEKTRKLKPGVCSTYPHQYHSTWLKSNNEFTIQNYAVDHIEKHNRPYSYASEDSQGNINPYAVTGFSLNCKDPHDHNSLWKENHHTNCLVDSIDLRPSTTSSERYFRPIILESSALDDQECSKRNPLVQIPPTYILSNQYQPPQTSSSVLSTISSSQGEIFSAFTFVPTSKQVAFNAKKSSNNTNTNNHILADQSSSSADSGVHSSYTQSPITKHSLRKCQFHGFSLDRPSSTDAHEDPERHFYATYDQQFAFLRGSTQHHQNRESSVPYKHQEQEQYSLV